MTPYYKILSELLIMIVIFIYFNFLNKILNIIKCITNYKSKFTISPLKNPSSFGTNANVYFRHKYHDFYSDKNTYQTVCCLK